jgi:hypothetical protein
MEVCNKCTDLEKSVVGTIIFRKEKSEQFKAHSCQGCFNETFKLFTSKDYLDLEEGDLEQIEWPQ